MFVVLISIGCLFIAIAITINSYLVDYFSPVCIQLWIFEANFIELDDLFNPHIEKLHIVDEVLFNLALSFSEIISKAFQSDCPHFYN